MKRSGTSSSRQPSPKRSRGTSGDGGACEDTFRTKQRDFPIPVATLRRRLRTLYKSCTVELNKGEGYAAESLKLSRVYANLHLVPREDLSADHVEAADNLGTTAGIEKLSHSFANAAKKLKKIPLGKIFHVKRSERRKMRNKSVLALALSCAGGGKTMLFTRKGPYEWAKKRIWKSIDLLFALELRSPEVRQAKTPEELFGLKGHGITRDKDIGDVMDYVFSRPERVCVILDGLDETRLSDCSDLVRNLIAGKRLAGIQLLLTSRHSSEVMELAQTTPFHRRVEVLGFQKEEVHRYVRNVLSPDDAGDVLAKLKTNPQLAAIMQTPFFAVATCKLYRSGVELPDTLGSIFSSLILNVIQQQQKETADFRQYGKWSSVPKAIKDSVLELGFFAFQMLIRKKIIFSDADLDTFEVSTEARSLGLLVACDKESLDKTSSQWRFSHLAIQESLAARHVASCNLSAGDTAWLVHHLGAFTGHLSTFWLLMAAELESKSADALVNAILNHQPATSSSSTTTSPPQGAGHCVTATEGHHVTYLLCTSRGDVTQWAEHLSEILSRDQVERLAIQLLHEHVGLGWPSLAVEAHFRPADVERTVDFMECLLLRWRRLVPRANTQLLHDAIASFAPGFAVRCFTNVPSSKTAQVQYRQSSSEPLPPLSECSGEEHRQRLLFACRCFSEHVNSEYSTAAIESLRPVVKKYGLDFLDVPLTPTDCHAVNSVLVHHHQSITKVGFLDCGIGDEGYDRLTAGLELCRNLTILTLALNSLSDRHAAHIGAVIRSNSSTLRWLYTSFNSFTSVGNIHLHQYTHFCTGLVGVSIGGQISETATDAPLNLVNITLVLKDCRNLQYIFLQGCTIGDDGLAQLQPLLTSLTLRGLKLEKIGLTPQCVPVLNLILQQQQRSLAFFSVTRNAGLTDSFLRGVSETLSQCTRMERIQLEDLNLTSASLPVLASLLPLCPCLRELYLLRNDFRVRDDDAESFITAIRGCATLKKLVMPESQLVDPMFMGNLQSVMARSGGNLTVEFRNVQWYDEAEEQWEEDDGEPEVEVVVVDESEIE